MPAKRIDRHQLDLLLDRADQALNRGQYEQALALSDEVLLIAPRLAPASHSRALALVSLGRFDQARQAYYAALKQASDDLMILHGLIDLLVVDLGEDREALEEALELCKKALRLVRKNGDRELRVELLLLAGMANDKLGDARHALELLDEARALMPHNAEVALERGIALFQMCRFDEAHEELERTLSLDKSEAWAHHYLGLIAERAGNSVAARRHFLEARRRNPQEFFPPVEVSPEAFDKAVQDALERLPGRVHRYLNRVTISVENLPSLGDLKAASPSLSPEIVGLFYGAAITDHSTLDPWSHFPSAIVLYQRNLQRSCRNKEELIEQIGITLIHEVGHFLGLSEEELYERGLD